MGLKFCLDRVLRRKELKKRDSSNPFQILDGLAPGVQVNFACADPVERIMLKRDSAVVVVPAATGCGEAEGFQSSGDPSVVREGFLGSR